jgi:glycosyltransferase involved in cell wall biosynthesis
MRPVPLMIMSDSPALPSGLARITKDLAVHAASLPEYRIATFGRGDVLSSKLPFMQYVYPEAAEWGQDRIEDVFTDFSGAAPGVIMTIFDLSRLNWFARPRMGGRLQEFLTSGRFQRWAYVPIDHHSIGGKLTGEMADTLLGFDRILAYTIFGKQVIEDTIGRQVDFIPHGINGDVFQPRDKDAGRAMLGVGMDERLIGCVMTNQSRKDWGTAFGAFAAIKKPGMKLWCHTDVPIRYWNLYALAEDFRVQNSVIFTFNGQFTSEQLSYCYSACDLTILPSLSEGWGFPITESLACGVPVIHGDYGGGVEQIPERDWLVGSVATRLDGQWNCIWPVWDPNLWGKKIEHVLNNYADGTHKDYCVNAINHLYWKNLFPSAWKPWFLQGLK